MTFGETLKAMRVRAGKSRYRLAQYSGLDQTYILRLERGERANPSRDVVLMLGLALVEGSESVGIRDIDELLLGAPQYPTAHPHMSEAPDGERTLPLRNRQKAKPKGPFSCSLRGCLLKTLGFIFYYTTLESR